jgi:Cu-Zn family superoxide dismutase
MSMIRARFALLSSSSLLLLACGGAAPAPEAPANPAPTAAAPEPAPAQSSAAPEATEAPKAEEAPKPEPKQEPIEVKIEPRSGSKLSGSIKLEPVEGGVKVSLMVKGAPPGHHGAHIHEKADCSAADGTSAGGHFNPEQHEHGLPPGAQSHLGDLGNLDVDKKGDGKLEITIKGANLIPGDKMSFLDRGVIIHAKKDDGGQPTGNAGGRIGCGEIKK